LQGQPLQILSALIARPGQIFTREDLKQQLWRDASFGDFEHGLNAAVNKLRQALGDSADQPRYVETLPGKGYRFIALVLPPSPVAILPPRETEQQWKGAEMWRTMLPWGVAGLLGIVAAVALTLFWRGTPTINRPLRRWSLELPDFALTPPNDTPGSSLALSPDGSRIVYTGRDAAGTFHLYTRTLDQDRATQLAGTEGAYGPFFSPDGKSVGFFANGGLKKTQIERDEVMVLCDASRFSSGGSWGEDGNIIAALGNGGLSRIPSAGGKARPVTELGKDLAHLWPQILPGGQVLFVTLPSSANLIDGTIEVQSLRTGERRTLARGASFGRYVPSGHLLYAEGGVLFAAPMDVKRLTLTGPATPVLRDFAPGPGPGYAHLAYSSDGTLVYVRAKPATQTLIWLDSNGQTQPLRSTPAEYDPAVRFSPDGKRLALAPFGNDGVDAWAYEWERDTMTRLTFISFAWWPVWSPDGRHLAFLAAKDGGSPNLYYMRADGVGDPVRLTESPNRQIPCSFSPDGKRLAFFEFNSKTGADIWTLTLDEAQTDHPKAGKPEPFLVTPFDERLPMISPDGRWIAYQSDESGRNEVYVKTFPGPGGRWQISTAGGDRPVWSKKAPELFFRSREGVMVASYTVGSDAFAASKPRVWAHKEDLGPYFDVSPDGKRFAVMQPVAQEQSGPEHVTVFQNFFDELRRRAPLEAK
jgi:serine/threonine-protein kinase